MQTTLLLHEFENNFEIDNDTQRKIIALIYTFAKNGFNETTRRYYLTNNVKEEFVKAVEKNAVCETIDYKQEHMIQVTVETDPTRNYVHVFIENYDKVSKFLDPHLRVFRRFVGHNFDTETKKWSLMRRIQLHYWIEWQNCKAKRL
jgi:hypothetical protein